MSVLTRRASGLYVPRGGGGGVTGYAANVLADAPLFYARLGEASGSTMIDSSGNGHNGTYTGVTLGSTGLISGDSDKAATFPGSTSSHADVPYGSWMNAGSNISVEAIVKPAAVTGGYQIFTRDGYSNPICFFLGISSSKATVTFVNNVGGSLTATGATTLVVGQTYHLAATYNGAVLKLYVNGILDGTFTSANTLQNANTATGFCIGAQYESPSYYNPFNGVIDEVAFYNTALSQVRVATHAAAAGLLSNYAVAVLTDAPSLYLKLDETSGVSPAMDASGNARNGTHTNVTINQSPLLTDPVGHSCTYNGTNAYTSVADAAWMNSSSVVASARIKWTSGVQQYIAGRFGGSGNRPWLFCVDTTGHLTVQVDGSAVLITGATAISSSVPTHVAFKCDNTNIKVYVNGSVDATVAHAGPTQTTIALEIARAASAAYSTLAADEFAFWAGTIPSDARIAAHAAAA